MPRFPYFGFPNPYYRHYGYYPNYNYQNVNNFSNANSTARQANLNQTTTVQKETATNEMQNKEKVENRGKDEETFFDLFGIKLYFDDILLVALIYFLYNEGVKDEGLFLALIMLLLT